MDKKWQDIHILYNDGFRPDNVVEYGIRQVNIKSIKTTELFIELHIIDAKEKPNTIIIPKLHGVKVLID